LGGAPPKERRHPRDVGAAPEAAACHFSDLFDFSRPCCRSRSSRRPAICSGPGMRGTWSVPSRATWYGNATDGGSGPALVSSPGRSSGPA
jgi:hypothetical protein